MKKLLFAVSALAALSLLAPSTGFAQFNNHIGIYTDAVASDVEMSGVAAFSTVTAHVVVTNPYNDSLGQEMSALTGAEWQVVPPVNVTILSLTFPTDAINVGTSTNVIAGFGAPLSVSGSMVKVGEYSIHYMDGGGGEALFHLAPAEPASITGMMAILDAANEEVVGCYPSSFGVNDGYDDPVFGINPSPDSVVATDEATFDSVKALYR